MSLKEQPNNCSLRLGVSGPTGAGKTTFSKILAVRGKGMLVEEPIPLLLLQKFGGWPKRFCLELQRAIVSSRVQLSKSHSEANGLVIFDRTLAEDREIFLRMHRKLGYLSKRAYEDLVKRCVREESKIGSPHGIIYLGAGAAELTRRMAATNVPKILIDSIDLQLNLYERWLERLELPIIRVDTTLASFQRLERIADWVVAKSPELIRGRWPKAYDFR